MRVRRLKEFQSDIHNFKHKSRKEHLTFLFSEHSCYSDLFFSKWKYVIFNTNPKRIKKPVSFIRRDISDEDLKKEMTFRKKFYKTNVVI
jgi:hypothetical protein